MQTTKKRKKRNKTKAAQQQQQFLFYLAQNLKQQFIAKLLHINKYTASYLNLDNGNISYVSSSFFKNNFVLLSKQQQLFNNKLLN